MIAGNWISSWIRLLLVLVVCLSFGRAAVAEVISGTLRNFDVQNNTGAPVDNLEVKLGGINAFGAPNPDINEYFPGYGTVPNATGGKRPAFVRQNGTTAELTYRDEANPLAAGSSRHFGIRLRDNLKPSSLAVQWSKGKNADNTGILVGTRLPLPNADWVASASSGGGGLLTLMLTNQLDEAIVVGNLFEGISPSVVQLDDLLFNAPAVTDATTLDPRFSGGQTMTLAPGAQLLTDIPFNFDDAAALLRYTVALTNDPNNIITFATEEALLVPEPATLPLAALAAFACWVATRRRCLPLTGAVLTLAAATAEANSLPFAGTVGTGRWPNGSTITVCIDVADNNMFNNLATGINRWQGQLAANNITLVTQMGSCPAGTGIVNVGLVPPGNAALHDADNIAFSAPTVSTVAGTNRVDRITGGSIVFQNNLEALGKAASGHDDATDTIQNLAAHEFSHMLGLAHPTPAQNGFVLSHLQTPLATQFLTQHDIDQYKALYAANPGRAGGGGLVNPLGALFRYDYFFQWIQGEAVNLIQFDLNGAPVSDLNLPDGWVADSYLTGEEAISFSPIDLGDALSASHPGTINFSFTSPYAPTQGDVFAGDFLALTVPNGPGASVVNDGNLLHDNILVPEPGLPGLIGAAFAGMLLATRQRRAIPAAG